MAESGGSLTALVPTRTQGRNTHLASASLCWCAGDDGDGS